GRVQLGALVDAGTHEFMFELVMTPRILAMRDPQGNDRPRVVGADLAAHDGTVVTPIGALPSVVLQPGATSGVTAVEPSPPRPTAGALTTRHTLPTVAGWAILPSRCPRSRHAGCAACSSAPVARPRWWRSPAWT